MSDSHKDPECPQSRVDELIDAVTLSDGCNSCLLAVIVPVVFVVLVWGMWILFTTPSPEPYKWDPNVMQGLAGFGTDTPIPLPSESSLPW